MHKINNSNYLHLLSKILITIAISAIVILSTISASCKITPEGITILDSDYSTPKLLNIQISNSSELYIEFDREIQLKNLQISSKKNPENKKNVDIENIQKNTVFYIDCKTDFSFLEDYQIFGVVEDEKFNTLTFSSTLTGFNGNTPKLYLSELRSYYQKPKLEYIEFLALSDGNLAGMILEVYYKTEPTEFIFPAIDVKRGDYIVVHGRKVDETCVNESCDLCASTYKDSVPNVVDFWIESESKVIGNSGVILIRNRKNGDIVDALLYREPEKETWANETVQQAATEAFNQGAWKDSGNIEDAAMNTKPSGTRSLSRDFSILENTEDSIAARNQWIFVNNGNATMGNENSLVPYEE